MATCHKCGKRNLFKNAAGLYSCPRHGPLPDPKAPRPPVAWHKDRPHG